MEIINNIAMMLMLVIIPSTSTYSKYENVNNMINNIYYNTYIYGRVF